MKLLVLIYTPLRGFLASLAAELATEHEVDVLVDDPEAVELVRELAPGLRDRVHAMADFSHGYDGPDVIADCLAAERRYGTRMALQVFQDRGLGRGYQFNVDRYPGVGKAWWPRERKYATVLEEFQMWERIMERFGPQAVVCTFQREIMALVAKYHGAAALSLNYVKYHSNMIWADDIYLTSGRYAELVRRYAADPDLCADAEVPEYEQVAIAKYNQSRLRFTWRHALKAGARTVAREVRALLAGRHKPDSYQFMGWLWPVLTRPYYHGYFRRHGVRPEDLAGRRTVLFNMHMEPEVALTTHSPEFSNTLELVSLVSKNLPADAVLVMKENPNSFGVRSRRYYDTLRQMPNVVLAHPEPHSWDWVRSCDLVAAVTGTVGTEAVHFKRPVLSFGKHQIINLLPTVRYVTDFASVAEGLAELLSIPKDSDMFEHSRKALAKAQMEVSVNMSGLEKLWKSTQPAPELARRAAEHLRKMHLDALANGPAEEAR